MGACWGRLVIVSRPALRKNVLCNLVQMRLIAAEIARLGGLTVRPSKDDEYDVDVRISTLRRWRCREGPGPCS